MNRGEAISPRCYNFMYGSSCNCLIFSIISLFCFLFLSKAGQEVKKQRHKTERIRPTNRYSCMNCCTQKLQNQGVFDSPQVYMLKFFIPPPNVHQFEECACAPSSGVLRPEYHIVPTPTSASSPGSATCRGCVRLGSRYTFGAGILVHYIWSWYSCFLYLELVFLFIIFGAGIIVHYIWSWYSCSLYLELVFLFCPCL